MTPVPSGPICDESMMIHVFNLIPAGQISHRSMGLLDLCCCELTWPAFATEVPGPRVQSECHRFACSSLGTRHPRANGVQRGHRPFYGE